MAREWITSPERDHKEDNGSEKAEVSSPYDNDKKLVEDSDDEA
jgi:hypothetical protein